MDLAVDERLRLRGWDVFRSSFRDRQIPLTGLGARLQRIRVNEALPVPGVFEGVAIELPEREARRVGLVERASRERGGEDIPLGIMQYFSTILHNRVVGAVNGVPLDETFQIAVAPFDGWLREISADGSAGDFGGFRIAVRTSNGGTLFRSFDQKDLALFEEFLEPDFLPFDARGTGNYLIELRGGKVPVYAGDGIFIVLRNTNGKAINQARARVEVGIEAVQVGSLARRVSAGAATLALRKFEAAQREAAVIAGRLAVEQERTRQVALVQRAETERSLLKSSVAKVAQRAPVPVPPPRVIRPPAELPAGSDKTFVSAWNPSYGYIGYLIPDPPRGGKVNVFDNKYSVFDITGKLIEQGPIIPIVSEADIPPGARLSPVRGGTKSVGMQLDTRGM
jgi:hypothetical protein